MEDSLLLQQYVRDGSESSFAELARRYVDLVYTAALRQVQDPHLAQDVCQQAFICLAKKAHTLGRERVLGGWLYRTTRYEAVKLLRSRTRCVQRESVAAESAAHAQSDDAPDWDAIAPILDEAMVGLRASEREVLLLRFFQNKPFKEVARALSISEDAAQKRVARALERLRAALVRRQVTISTAALAGAIGIQAVQAAPAGLASALVTTSLAAGSSAAGTTFALTLFNIMATSKLKIAALSGVLVAAVSIPVGVQHRSLAEQRAENQQLRQQLSETEQRHQAQFEGMLAQVDAAATSANQTQELLALRQQVALLRQRNAQAGSGSPTTAADAGPDSLGNRILTADELAALRRRVLDVHNTVEDRLSALRSLRGKKLRDPTGTGVTDARDSAVVAAMAQLAESSAEPGARADIFRQLHGVTNAVLKRTLLQALAQDPSAKAREEAAETLDAYRDEPDVRAWLQHACRNDVELDVRQQALVSLMRDRPAAEFEHVLSDSSATDLEMYYATRTLRRLSGPTSQQAAGLWNILERSKEPKIRQEAVEDLVRYYSSTPGVADWLKHLAENDPDGKVREEASRFFARR